MLFRRSQRSDISAAIVSACQPVVELLEDRRLFAETTVQALPFVLDFASDRGEIADKDGQGTGFTRIQANKLATQYKPLQIDLDTAAGVLKLTTSGTSSAGSNFNGDNTLVNALETQFDGTTSGWKITARLVGPLSYIDTPSEQGGIMFGPDQDNYIKIVAIAQSGQQYIQFNDEQTTGTTYSHTISQLVSVGSFASISTLDLQLQGDASNGSVNAYYSVNGGAFQKVPGSVTLSGAKYAQFFNSASRAGLIALHKNNGSPITVAFDNFKIEGGTVAEVLPKVTATRPAHNESNVSRDAFVAADLFLPTPGAGVDTSTLNSNTVLLYRTSDHSPVAGVINTSGGGDAIVFTPTSLLDPNTNYTFEVTSGVKDTSGASFMPYTATFTTGAEGGEIDSTLAFEKVNLPNATGQIYTSVNIGPDGKLYASTVDGIVQRFNINPDGTLSAPFNITSLQAKEGGATIIIGLAFAPNGDLWVSHNQFSDISVGGEPADDWTGKISKLSGTNYGTATTMVVNLPRSVRDHMTNQLTFGPDGALYFNQGANTAMGAADNTWGNRPEHLLNSAVLRLDLSKLGASPLDVKTDSGGTYNPFNANNALTIYATGVRNAYDMVWTSTGRLFVPTNGSAAGGNAPGTPAGSYSFGADQRIDFATNGAYTGPNVPTVNNGPTQNDYVFNVVKGGYYGQPNPSRGEFVLNGGNPTAGVDTSEVTNYPVGTQPDRNYRGNITGAAANTQGSAYIFGKNYSPNGIIEYKSNAFGGLLKGKLLVAAYSGGDEVFVLTPDVNGNIIKRQSGIAGLTHFIDPLDLTEDTNTGFLYVIEYGAMRITLVRPITPGANATTDKSQMVFNDPTSAGASPAQKITITNTGTAALAFPADAFSITGTDAARFAITQKPTLPTSIAPGESVDVLVTFTAGASDTDVLRTANLQIKSNDPNQPTFTVPLRGLGTSGTGGANEPSLQQLMNLYQIQVNVGDTTPSETNLNDPPAQPNDEVVMPTLIKAGLGPVTIESIAVFGVGSASVPTFRFGYYTPGNKNDLTELLVQTGTAGSQSVNPNMVGSSSFDPGSAAFGLYTYWQNFSGKPTVYSEDQLNKPYHAASPRKVRFYPLKENGTVVPDAYVFAFEEFNQSTDVQDYVGIIRNVQAAPGIVGPEIGFENTDGVPFSDRLVFNKIQDFTTPGLPNNIFHGTTTLKLRNTGASTLTVASLVVSSGWQLVNPPADAFNIAPGGEQNITVQFIANPGGSVGQVLSGTLTVNSNDADEPISTIQLSGHWQPQNENNDEPSLQQIVSIFGWQTKITNAGQVLNRQGRIERVGDEVLSPYWHRADSSSPVTVRQLSAYHSMPNVATIYWHNNGSNTTTSLFTMDGEEAQSFLPHKNNSSTGVVGVDFAAGSFSPAGSFGFKIDTEWSDPTKNSKPNPNDQGHHVRFWVVKDRSGNVVPNTYLVSMDYSGINYDYQDNTYLVTNLAPDSAPSVPTGLAANGAGISLNWNDNTEANLAGYNVYRSTTSGGTYTKLNASPLIASDYLDAATTIGATYFYKVTSVDTSGNESAQTAFVSATRTNDAAAPAPPANFIASGMSNGISLDWANNTEADLAGYNIYRSSTPGGPFTLKLNTNLLGSSSYFDSTAPVGVISYYMVEAVDSSTNKSGPSFAQATRLGNDTVKPAAPTGVVPTPSTAGIAIDWADNSESDLAGYNVYRSPNGSTNWTKLNGSLLGTSFFNDTTAPANAESFYRISAVDTSNNESDFATTSATRPPADTDEPTAPTGLGASDSPAGVNLNWDDNVEPDLAGYNVYRSATAGGTYTKLNASLLTSSNYLDTTATGGANYYRVTAVDTSTNESADATISAQHVVPWSFADIGSPTPAGSFSPLVENKDYNLVAGGTDVYGTSDKFAYLSQQMSGDFDFIVRVAGITNTNSGAKGGLMARESLAANSRNVFAYATPGAAGYRMTWRSTIGGSTSAAGSGTVAFPNGWVRLARVVNSFTGYRSTNGVDWTVISTTTLNVGATMYVGMAGVSKNASAATTVQFRNLTNLSAPPPDLKPAAPTSFGATANQGRIDLDWADNAEGDLQGYNVYRREGSSGPFTLLNTGGLVTSSAYADTSAAEGVFYEYRVTAVDLANQESDPSVVAPATWIMDLKPDAPEDILALGSAEGISLNWSDNLESDLAGYNVYRSDSENGTFTKINASLVPENDYFDATAPVGMNFYRLTAVDDAGQESEPSGTVSAERLPDTTPAQPQNFVATPGTDGILLEWDANTESDLAGYRLVRSTDGVNWEQLNGLLTFTTFKDTFAQPGVLTYYSVAAVDVAGQESTGANVGATRPAVAATIKINFQNAGSPTVAGYFQDNGLDYGDRGNGQTYGWNGDYSANARDRNINSDQLLDTIMHFYTGSKWTIALANGSYTVKVSVGDALYATTHTLSANGVSVFNAVGTAANQFKQQTVTVTVTNGKLELNANGQVANRATRINYIEITPV